MGKYGESDLDINFIQPLPQAELFKIASMNDIGLALETGKDLNNGIALSNKIFTYLLAGNAIIFSDTDAQRQFYEENTEVGLLYHSGDVESLQKLLSRILANPEMVDDMKRNALRAATERHNWEMESQKLTAIIEAL
jgi:glycosyltransferase involved in cell wall biosynthesis